MYNLLHQPSRSPRTGPPANALTWNRERPSIPPASRRTSEPATEPGPACQEESADAGTDPGARHKIEQGIPPAHQTAFGTAKQSRPADRRSRKEATEIRTLEAISCLRKESGRRDLENVSRGTEEAACQRYENVHRSPEV